MALCAAIAPIELWRFLPVGFVLTILIEIPILFWGLSPRHSRRRRIGVAIWLTACTYPVVVLVLPPLLWRTWGSNTYLVTAETFAVLAECLLFRMMDANLPSGLFRAGMRDMMAIVAANVCSLIAGEYLVGIAFGW